MFCTNSFKGLVNTLLTGDIKQKELDSPLNARAKLPNHSIHSSLTSA